MSERVTSLNTKRMFADKLKELLRTKPLNKIKATEIIRLCGVNHKTFYYHFNDIFDLVHWMLEQETVGIISQYDVVLDFDDVVLYMLRYVRENNHLLNILYDDIGTTHMKQIFYQDIYHVAEQRVNAKIEEGGFCISDRCRGFICRTLTELISGILTDLLKEKDSPDDEELLSYIHLLIEPSLLAAIREADRNKL